jgi:hypothetical protein
MTTSRCWQGAVRRARVEIFDALQDRTKPRMTSWRLRRQESCLYGEINRSATALMLIDSDEPTRSQVGGPNYASSENPRSTAALSARFRKNRPFHAGFFGGTSFFPPKCQSKKTAAANTPTIET